MSFYDVQKGPTVAVGFAPITYVTQGESLNDQRGGAMPRVTNIAPPMRLPPGMSSQDERAQIVYDDI